MKLRKVLHTLLNGLSRALGGRVRACCVAVLLSFAAGSFIGSLRQVRGASANSDLVYELRVYHAVAGKLPALESRFRDTTSKLLAKHGLRVVGYWTSVDAGPFENSFVWLVAHGSREAAKENWDKLRVDPAFQEMAKSEQAEKLVEKVESTYLRASDFSGMK